MHRMLFTTIIVFDSKGSLWMLWLFMFNVNLRVAYVSIWSELNVLNFFKSSSVAYKGVA